ncbi:MAG: DNRLRE domain-containing protein, partial [Clostridia bacterium]|nr:DNRLRE domain-containing protein [Clostridia bacterium]
MSRLRQEETDEYTFVFLNNDGTRTSYSYGVPVKYADENGVMHDKNNTIKAFNSEYGNTAGDVELRFPQKLNKVRIGYKGHSIQINPVTEVSAGHISAVVSGNTVVYPGAFGQGIDLRYASVMSGIKEDIILQSYSGKNSFSFEIKTGGLALDEINGQYAITDGEKIIFSFGDLEVLDSFNGENEAEDNWDEHRTTAQGEIVTLKENDRYIFTVTVAEDFLTSPSTVYPVYIDPSFNVTSQYITDTYISEGAPNTNYGTGAQMKIGYGSSTQRNRILVQLSSMVNGTTRPGLNASSINNATYHMYCTTTYTSQPYVDVYMIPLGADEWSDTTATWNNAYNNTSSTTYLQGSTIVGSSGWYNFNVTNAYKSWFGAFRSRGLM